MGEKEMKSKLIIGLLLLSIVFIAGCVAQQAGLGKGSTTYPPNVPPKDHSYLKDVQSSETFIAENQKFDVNFVIVNPLRQSSDLVVELRYDLSNCFTDTGKKTISIPANDDTSSGITIIIQRFYADSKCVGTRTITVTLLDKNNQIVDFSNMFVNIKSS